MNRTTARRHAFVLVFQIPFHKEYDAETLAEAYHDYFNGLDENKHPDDKSAAYLIRTTSGLLDNLQQIDESITNYLKGWRLERLNRVDLAVLRLSVYEILYEQDIPSIAVINEAVELAKRFGDDESPSFINGLLGSIINEQAG